MREGVTGRRTREIMGEKYPTEKRRRKSRGGNIPGKKWQKNFLMFLKPDF